MSTRRIRDPLTEYSISFHFDPNSEDPFSELRPNKSLIKPVIFDIVKSFSRYDDLRALLLEPEPFEKRNLATLSKQVVFGLLIEIHAVEESSIQYTAKDRRKFDWKSSYVQIHIPYDDGNKLNFVTKYIPLWITTNWKYFNTENTFNILQYLMNKANE